ncbi:hypothetical protein FRC07_013934, partial [Ceratobasidium sp. 392]
MIHSAAAVAAAALSLLASPVSAQNWGLSQGGSTGVAAMQMTVASATNVVIIDKHENNPLHDENGKPVWGAVYSTSSDTARPLHIATNTFCATGTWLSNGTLANVGGNPSVESGNATSQNGLQGIRLFNACADDQLCDIIRLIKWDLKRIRITTWRWYPSSVRMADGSSMIMGGAYGGAWTNFAELNNPTYEYYPPKNMHGYNGMRIPSQFLVDSLPHNMFPHMMLLPDGKVFVAANNMAMILDWQANTERRLPNLPNGQMMTYPMSGAGVLLPLTPENNYTPEVMLCGGSQISPTLKENEVSSQSPASKQCSRM